MNTHERTLRSTLLPESLVSGPAARVALALVATLVVAAAAHVAIPLPFTPVPLTMQPLAVLCVGLLLGPVDGALAMLAYLAEGSAGLPVFAPTGPGGVLQLLGPTGGFLMSYPLVAALAGACAHRLRVLPRFAAGLVGSVAATALLFFAGALWLQHLLALTPAAVWHAAVVPFLPGAVIHALVAAGIYRAVVRPVRIP